MDEQARPWYAAGLYRRIQERRRFQPERTPRKPWRQRLVERGLHWNLETVVGAFVAVVAASFITVALATGSAASLGQVHVSGGGADFSTVDNSGSGGGGGAGAGDSSAAGGGSAPVFPTPTPKCVAAPIPGLPLRPCTY